MLNLTLHIEQEVADLVEHNVSELIHNIALNEIKHNRETTKENKNIMYQITHDEISDMVYQELYSQIINYYR